MSLNYIGTIQTKFGIKCPDNEHIADVKHNSKIPPYYVIVK